jgi:hypothetical protein
MRVSVRRVQPDHLDPVRGQARAERGHDVPGPDADLGRHPLGGEVQVVDVVVPPVEVVARLLVRHHRDLLDRRGGSAFVGEQRQLLDRLPVTAVQRHQRPCGVGQLLGQFGRLARRLGRGQQVVGDDLADLGDEPRGVVGGEEPGVDAELLAQAQQHRNRQRPRVVLDLVEVARRHRQPSRQRGLAQPAVLP